MKTPHLLRLVTAVAAATDDQLDQLPDLDLLHRASLTKLADLRARTLAAVILRDPHPRPLIPSLATIRKALDRLDRLDRLNSTTSH